MFAMNTTLLAEMGISYASGIVMPEDISALNMRLTVTKNGNSVTVFCNGGMSEYDTLSNHGATKYEVEVRTVCSGEVPYLTLPAARLTAVLRSIAFIRILTKGTPEQKRKHQSLANAWAQAWLAGLPSEANRLYQSDVAADEYADSL